MASNDGVLQGRLTKDRFGPSIPADAPYYQEPPFFYKNVDSMAIAYETDPEAAADILPEGVDVILPAQAALSIIHYPTSTFGPYNEAILSIRCALDGLPHTYIAHIVVDTVPPLVGGREIWGFPKKIAHISMSQEQELVHGTVERPEGLRLATATMRPERLLEPTGGSANGGSLSLKVIPSAEKGKPPSIAELIRVPPGDRTIHEAWTGPATVSFDTASDLDPWYRLPVRKVLGATRTRYDFTLGHGEIVRCY